MIKVIYNKVCGRCVQSEPLTSGMVGQPIEFEYSPDFDGLTLTAVFTNGKTTVDVLNPGNQCIIPHEVLDTVGEVVKVGIYAVRGNELVIPTVYATIGVVLKGADPSGDVSADPTLPVWAQIQGIIGDLNDLNTEAKNNLVAAINEAAQTGGGGANIALRVEGGYIQYTVDGKTWANLIAVADLKGAKGETGPQGPKGDTGNIGPQGPKGDTGAAGPKGDTGEQGPQGPKGDKGDTGPQGLQGPKGDAFTYADFTETQLLALKGPKGDKGDTGAMGPQGIQGIQGSQGERGPQGDKGADGKDGADGHTPVKGVDYFTEADKNEIAEDAASKVNLSSYRTAAAQDVIDSGKQDKLIAGENITISADGKTISATGGGGSTIELDTTLSETGKAADAKAVGDALADKQDTISDLVNIRSGAAKGATALQSVPSSYRTAEAQDVIDNGKQDKITSTNKLAYSLISGTPTIPTVPTNVSAFTNDAGYLTLATLPKYEGVVE